MKMKLFRYVIIGSTVCLLICVIYILQTDKIIMFRRGARINSDKRLIPTSSTTATSFNLIADKMYVYPSDSSLNSPKPCHHIAFLKVHKAASSTAQNIFLRYGYERNLTFVLPRPPGWGHFPNVISYFSSVNENNIVPPPANKTFDILCNHVIYNREAFQAIMPNDTVYIGIVREPSEHVRSIIQYFHPGAIYRIKNTTNPISAFFKNPRRYTRNQPSSEVNNRMAYEYDFPKSTFETRNLTDINNYLHKLASEFSLVIIVEYFEESLVLMRRILNWNMKDILYIKNNVSGKKRAPKLSPEDKQRHRQWAVLEYALYDFFFKRLWEQINSKGSDFYGELIYFKSVRRDVTDFCLGIKSVKELVIISSKWNDEFVVTEHDCHLMLKGEIPFVQSIRKLQYGSLTYGTLP